MELVQTFTALGEELGTVRAYNIHSHAISNIGRCAPNLATSEIEMRGDRGEGGF
jgi:hypothetical protein